MTDVDGISWDTSEYERALVEYAAATKKDWPEICNKKAASLAIRTISLLPKAVAEEINWLEFEIWWPMYISRRCWEIYGRSHTVRGPRGGYVPVYAWTHDEAREESDSILRGRRSSVSFMKGGFGRLSRILGRPSGTSVRRHGMSHAAAILATVAKPLTEMRVEYDSYKGPKDVAGKLKMAYEALYRAMNIEAKDMWDYTERKMRERGAAISV